MHRVSEAGLVMSIRSEKLALPRLYTGRSTFLKANQHLVESMLLAASRCEIQSSEDIYDANGMMLWARQRRVGPALLAKLADRKLAKPIELCVTALDPVSTLSMVASLDALSDQSPDFALLLAPIRDELLAMLMRLEFSPQELLLLSVLRFGGSDRLTHALAVAAIGVVAALWLGLRRAEQLHVLRAGLLHDVGMLYLPAETSQGQDEYARQRHPRIGASCVAELTRCLPPIAELIAQSHERLNGQGFPRGLRGPQLGRASQALGFAEAIADPLCQIGMGAQRAVMCSRIVAGEFAQELVSGLSALARGASIGPDRQVPARRPACVALALRHLHAELSRVVVLLSMTFGEDDLVREAASHWLGQVNPLMRALQCSGIEDALAQGLDIQPVSPQEHGELAAMHAEIVHRVQCLLGAMEFRCTLSQALAESRLLRETQRLLKSACSPPDSPPDPLKLSESLHAHSSLVGHALGRRQGHR
jgi:hypothetical protein